MNLALNARDAMTDGGELRIATSLVHLDDEYCRRHPSDINPGEYVELSVTDNGCGMDSETKARIFEPFFTTKSAQKGTGMGLSAAWGTIKNHGGTIDVYSEPGLGTTMRVYLPYTASLESAGPQKERVVLKSGSARILLVDDEPMVVDTGVLMLQRLGYSVISCSDGTEALEIFKEKFKEIDVVILDMVMPNMDGRTTHLRLREIHPEVRVLLSSGYSLDGAAQEMLNEGVNGFIQKPFRMPVLSEKLAEITAQVPR
jgi:CheY-like chemotaxis protein